MQYIVWPGAQAQDWLLQVFVEVEMGQGTPPNWAAVMTDLERMASPVPQVLVQAP
jgi:hypothetical protein